MYNIPPRPTYAYTTFILDIFYIGYFNNITFNLVGNTKTIFLYNDNNWQIKVGYNNVGDRIRWLVDVLTNFFGYINLILTKKKKMRLARSNI